MLSSEHGIPKRRHSAGRVVLFALLAALSLSGCVVQPLYGSTPSGKAVKTVLAKISIEPVDDRVAQVVRNKLIFGFTGGAAAPRPDYNMKLTTSVSEVALGITKIEAAPSYAVTVTVTYDVTKVGATDVLQHVTVSGTASYNRANQVFANTRARLDAENRAAQAASDQILIRVAAAIARSA